MWTSAVSINKSANNLLDNFSQVICLHAQSANIYGAWWIVL